MKYSLWIWHYVVSVKSTVKIWSIFVAFLQTLKSHWTAVDCFVNFLTREFEK